MSSAPFPGDQVRVVARRLNIEIGGGPISVLIVKIGWPICGCVGQPFQNEIAFLERGDGGRSIKDIAIHALGRALIEDAQSHLIRIGAHIIDLDAKFLLKSLGRRSDELINDLRRIPGDLTLLLSGGDQRRIIGIGLSRSDQSEFRCRSENAVSQPILRSASSPSILAGLRSSWRANRQSLRHANSNRISAAASKLHTSRRWTMTPDRADQAELETIDPGKAPSCASR